MDAGSTVVICAAIVASTLIILGWIGSKAGK